MCQIFNTDDWKEEVRPAIDFLLNNTIIFSGDKFSMHILIEEGIFHVVQVEKQPESGDLLNLDGLMLERGVYPVQKIGIKKWGGITYPHYKRARQPVSPIPQGMSSLPCELVSI